MATVSQEESRPLLPGAGQGKASVRKTYANIIISVVGSGVLGLPFTYKASGWVVATSSLVVSGVLAYYCMMLLVKCRDKLSDDAIQTYPDLGQYTFGKLGRQTIEIALLISQVGCCVAYLIFIGRNISSVFLTGPRDYYLRVILLLALLEVVVSWVRSLSTLAPFSIFANACNALAMAVVIKEDISKFKAQDVEKYTSWTSIPFALGVCIYCYEGFGMTLSLQSSMKKPHKFGPVLGQSFVLITILYFVFGFAGYLAFGNETQDIVTLNLDNEAWSTRLVKFGLSVALFFTFPVMMYPVYEIVEMRLLSCGWFRKQVAPSPRLYYLCVNLVRCLLVVLVAVIAALVPGFSTFISLVGSTVCALLAFVFPALFHCFICGSDSSLAAKVVDWSLLGFGAVFAAYGTYDACRTVFHIND